MNPDAQQIGIAIGLIVAASLAMQTALGPAMANIVEACKAAGLARDGRAGLLSLAIGTVLGAAAGLLAMVQSAQPNPVWIGVGAFAGLIGLGAGGVRSHLVSVGTEQQRAAAESATVAATSAAPAAAAPLVEIPANPGKIAA
jgi:hypothetical protein